MSALHHLPNAIDLIYFSSPSGRYKQGDDMHLGTYISSGSIISVILVALVIAVRSQFSSLIIYRVSLGWGTLRSMQLFVFL